MWGAQDRQSGREGAESERGIRKAERCGKERVGTRRRRVGDGEMGSEQYRDEDRAGWSDARRWGWRREQTAGSGQCPLDTHRCHQLGSRWSTVPAVRHIAVRLCLFVIQMRFTFTHCCAAAGSLGSPPARSCARSCLCPRPSPARSTGGHQRTATALR